MKKNHLKNVRGLQPEEHWKDEHHAWDRRDSAVDEPPEGRRSSLVHRCRSADKRDGRYVGHRHGHSQQKLEGY